MGEAVRLDDLTGAMASRGIPLQSETALFVALMAVEAMRTRPAVVTPEDVTLDADGAVQVRPDAPTTDDLNAMHESVVALLETLLVPPPTSVLDLGARVRAGELTSHSAFVAELTAMLVPLNRAAATRMLGRLVREHARARRPAPPAAEGAAEATDTLLDAPPGLGEAPAAEAMTEGPDAAATLVDAEVRQDWDDALAPPRARRSERWDGVLLLFLSMLCLGASAVFLWSRLR